MSRGFTLFKKKDKPTCERNQIDISRSESHRIFDITQILGKCSFTRNSNFKYKTTKNEKVYMKKSAELKIERYENQT